MNKLFTKDEYDNTKCKDKLPLKCCICNETFYVTKAIIKEAERNKGCVKFCSHICSGKAKTLHLTITTDCSQCGQITTRTKSQLRKSKEGRVFCSNSCSAKYNNAQRITGVRKSSWEFNIIDFIKKDFPELKVEHGVIGKIPDGLEIDIYIPELNLAIELNGPVHYLPIYGQDKLDKIFDRDIRKQAYLHNANITLIILDISHLNTNNKKYQEIFNKMYLQKVKPLIEMIQGKV